MIDTTNLELAPGSGKDKGDGRAVTQEVLWRLQKTTSQNPGNAATKDIITMLQKNRQQEQQFVEAVYNLDLPTVTEFFETNPELFSCDRIFERKKTYHVDLVSLVCAAENNPRVPEYVDRFDTAKTIMGFVVEKNGVAAVLKKTKDLYYTHNVSHNHVESTFKVPVEVSPKMQAYFTALEKHRQYIEKITSDLLSMVDGQVDPKVPGSQQAAKDIHGVVAQVKGYTDRNVGQDF